MKIMSPANFVCVQIRVCQKDIVGRKLTKTVLLSKSGNINRSGDNKWVYEYTWDLKNGDGNMVAPGVYFYLVRVDGNNKTGKIVVIR